MAVPMESAGCRPPLMRITPHVRGRVERSVRNSYTPLGNFLLSRQRRCAWFRLPRAENVWKDRQIKRHALSMRRPLRGVPAARRRRIGCLYVYLAARAALVCRILSVFFPGGRRSFTISMAPLSRRVQGPAWEPVAASA